MESNRNTIHALEAILFAAGDSMPAEKLCAVLNIDRAELEACVSALADEYDYHMRGIRIVRLDDRYQLVSRSEYADVIRKALESGRPPVLSQSALEALAIIAYKQPVTRAYIDQVRGVDSGHTVSSLVDKGLIESCGRLDVPGRPNLYATTEKFLRSFGLSDLEQLPYIEGFEIEHGSEQLSLQLEMEEEGEPL